MEAENTICRLCLKMCNADFKTLEASIQEALNFLLLNLDFSVSHEPIICGSCLDSLKKSSDFKATYLRKKDGVISFNNGKNTNVIEPKVCRSAAVAVPAVSNMCYFCSKPVNHDSFVHLKDVRGYIIENSQECFPNYLVLCGLVVNITEDSVVCEPCYKCLLCFITFVGDCLNVEEKIREYCKVESTNNRGQVNLSSVVLFTSKNTVLNQTGNSINDTIKLEENWEQANDEMVEAEVKVKDEGFLQIEKHGLDLKKEIDQIKMEQDDSDRSNEKSIEIYIDHRGIKIYKCQTCSREFKCERHFNVHTHSKIHKCELCAFQTINKHEFLRHKHGRKSPSEYMCEVCPFRTPFQRSLLKHMDTHRSLLEIKAFRCKLCSFHTRHRRSIQTHMSTKRHIQEAELYQQSHQQKERSETAGPGVNSATGSTQQKHLPLMFRTYYQAEY